MKVASRASGFQGTVVGAPFSALMTTSPLLLCEDDVMTLTASGEDFSYLLVDRGESFELSQGLLGRGGAALGTPYPPSDQAAVGINPGEPFLCPLTLPLPGGDPPISPLQLPPYCGYLVKPSWPDVQLMMPYDACFIKQEVGGRGGGAERLLLPEPPGSPPSLCPQNGSYVLPLLWWGDPLKLLCPVHPPVPSPSPAVFCSSSGMAVQVDGLQPAMRARGVLHNVLK